jgi:hypothetical protein
VLPRSQYERVLIRAISGDKLHMDGDWYTPTGMRGWSRVIFRRKADNSRHVFSLDYLLDHLREWERPGRGKRGAGSSRRDAGRGRRSAMGGRREIGDGSRETGSDAY